MALQQIQIARYDPRGTQRNYVGEALQQVGQTFDRLQEKERILQKEEEQLASQQFGFEPNEDASESLQIVQQAAATDLVNDAAEYARLHRTGKMSTEEFNAKNQELQKQIQKIKAGHTFLEGAAGKFEEYQDNPDLMSGYTSPETLAVMKGMKDGSITYSWNPANNRMEYSGTYMLGGKEVEMPPVGVGKEGAFPTPIDKTQDPKDIFDNIGQDVAKNDVQTWTRDGITYTGYQWDSPGVKSRFEGEIDEIVGNEGRLISTAVDYLGYTPDQVDALQKDGKLAEEVRGKLLSQAEASIGEGKWSSKISSEATQQRQQAQDQRAEEQATRAQEQYDYNVAQRGKGGGAGLTPNKAHEVHAEEIRLQQERSRINTALSPNTPQLDNKGRIKTDAEGKPILRPMNDEEREIAVQGLVKGNISGAEYTTSLFGTKRIELTIKGIDEPVEFELDEYGQLPDNALQFIYNQNDNLGNIGTRPTDKKDDENKADPAGIL